MISGKVIGNHYNDRLSVAYSPAANLPQINSDNDNSVGTLEARVRALIVDANERSRVYTRRTTKPVSLWKQRTVQCDDIAAVLRSIRRTLVYPTWTQPETLHACINARLIQLHLLLRAAKISTHRYSAPFPLFTLSYIVAYKASLHQRSLDNFP